MFAVKSREPVDVLREEDGGGVDGERRAGEDATVLGEQSREDAPQKPDCPAIPSRISRRATGTEAPALTDSMRAAPAMGMQKSAAEEEERGLLNRNTLVVCLSYGRGALAL